MVQNDILVQSSNVTITISIPKQWRTSSCQKIPELHGLLKFNHFYPEVAVQSDRLGEGSPEGSVVVRTNDKRLKNLSGSHEQS